MTSSLTKSAHNLATLKGQVIETFRCFKPERIIFFGSMARGDSDSSSDLDLIVVYETDKRFLDRLEELYESWKIPRAVDILAYTPAEYEEMLLQNSFLQRVVSEGQVIYEEA